MAALSPEAARERFQAALQDKNYGSRCHLLASLGKELRALGQPQLEALLDGLTGTPPAEGTAFNELARLIVAKAANCLGYSQRLLDHPSRAVRFEAVRGGLLRPEDAHKAFLSADSSLGLKKLLVGCSVLPCDREVMEHAWQLFGAQDRGLVWELMTRVTDEALLRSWLLEHEREEMTEWLGNRINSMPCRSPPGLPGLARRFPQVMVDLVKQGSLKWAWFWTKDVLNADPALVLKTTFLDGHRRGSGPKKGYNPNTTHQRVDQTLASWGWRHQPEVMLSICRDRAEAEHRSDDIGEGKVVDLARWLMEATSTRWYLTTSQKLSHLISIWSLIPVAHRTADAALKFEALLPTGLEAHRTKDLEQLVGVFWKIISDLGRAPRKEILVGGPCLKSFLKKLPVPLAVDQFFRILEEFEADGDVYKFVMSGLCKSTLGTHDGLILRVFKRYLQKEGLNAAQAAAMFHVLLTDARTMDVIQDAFNLLLQRLDHKMDCKLMACVVKKMGELEKASRIASSGVVTPKATLPVPAEWVQLVQLPKDCRSHVDFLLHVLHTNRDSDAELLGAMIGKYGPSFFWDALGHVVAAVSPGGLQQQEPPPPDMALFKKLDISSVMAPLQQLGASADASQESADAPPSRYFTTVADLKKKTLGKDPAQRSAGYTELMTVAQKERSQVRQKAFEDLLPFLVGRFSGEQDSVRSSVLKDLLKTPLLPFKLWGDMLSHLTQLWKISSKSRRAGETSNDTRIWAAAGVQLVEQALRDWTTETEPNAACAFGLELNASELDLPAMFVKLQKECEEGKSLSDAAARWVFERAVPLTSDTEVPISIFWTTLKKLADIVEKDKGAERALWERWSFVAERWRALLAPGVAQKAMRFALVDTVEVLTKRSDEMAKRNDEGKITELWWEPLECAEYREAVSKIFGQMESGDIPAKEAAVMLANRVEALTLREVKANSKWAVRGRKRRERKEDGGASGAERMSAKSWVKEQSWDVPKHHLYKPLPWDMVRCSDGIATEELRTLSKLLGGGQAQRQVLWQVISVAAMLAGSAVSGLMEEAITTLDARFEGMARCIGRHYPYLNAALTKFETQNDSSDVLTPLLELWLFDDGPRDANVAKLMERQDCEYFLFFGISFARHLSNKRQEWLHRCLQKLHAPGAGGAEFYHFPRRGPMLHQVAQLGSANPGWRRTLQGCKPKVAEPLKTRAQLLMEARMRRSKRGRGKGRRSRVPPPVPVTNNGIVGSVQVHLWHVDTQAEFLQKALFSTEKDVLALMARIEFADGVAQADEMLKSFPKEQTVKQSGSDIWGWEVIQAAGAYSNLKDEIQRRFMEQPAPWVCDAVGDAELDTLLCALGRADNALQGLGVLGRYAGKVKRVVKESVTKLIIQVKPSRARDIISNVMLPRKSGVGLQVAGLRKIAQLQVPEPLELYRKAWSNGKCPRDVAGIILAKVNTAQSFSPEDVRGFFDFFSQMAGQQDECCYVAGLLLDQLIESPNWSLPFLPEVVSKLAMLPGMASKAMSALQSSTSHTSEVIKALTEVLRAARIATRIQPSVAKESPEAQTLSELTALMGFGNLVVLTSSLTRLRLEKCDAAVLLGFVDQVLCSWQDAARKCDNHADNLLRGALVIWVKLLRVPEMTSWPSVLSAMEERLARQIPGGKAGGKSEKFEKAESRPQNLQALAQAVANHITGMILASAQRSQALAIVGDFFLQLMDKHLKVRGDENEEADSAFDQEESAREKVADEVLVKSWAGLLAHGCPEAESTRLFAKCPASSRVKLARQIMSVAVEDIKEKAASRAQWRQKRPEQGWKRTTGLAVEDVKVGSRVNGVVTNSSAQHGVFFNFGCVKDGKLNVPTADWKKYHVGDEVRGMIVNSVDIKENNQFIELILVGEADKVGGGAFEARDMAHKTLAWLASPVEQRHLHFSTLAELWASVMALERDSSGFEAALDLLGTPPPPPGSCVRVVVELLEKKPSKSIIRPALAWLGRVSPEDAVQLWPALLGSSASQQDVEALLALCEAHGFEPPPLPKLVARSLSVAVLKLLAASSLPEARLLVVQALSEQHWNFNDLPPVLAELCKDPCEVVKVAARNLWVGLESSADKKESSKKEEAEDGEGGSDSDSDSDDDDEGDESEDGDSDDDDDDED